MNMQKGDGTHTQGSFKGWFRLLVVCAASMLFLHPIMYVPGWGYGLGCLALPVFASSLACLCAGSLAWCLLRRRKWWVMALLIWLVTSAVTLLSVSVAFRGQRIDGFTGLFILSSFMGNILLSLIPICFVCKRYSKSNHQSATKG